MFHWWDFFLYFDGAYESANKVLWLNLMGGLLYNVRVDWFILLLFVMTLIYLLR